MRTKKTDPDPRGPLFAISGLQHDQSLYHIVASSGHFFQAMDIACIFNNKNFSLKFVPFF
jgi:hypothetical protein